MLRNLGSRIFYADQVGKDILVTDPTARAALMRLLGSEAYFDDDSLNRTYVASRVFNDENLLAKLNLIVHPRVEAAFKVAHQQADEEGVELLTLEAALLFESQLHRMLDSVAVVVSRRETRIDRVVGRDGVTSAAVTARMQHQATESELLSIADFVIENNGSLKDLERAVELLHSKFLNDT